MAKPTVRVPLWADTGPKTDPGAPREAAGWAVSERPPANWMNWLANARDQWLTYFANESWPTSAACEIWNSDTLVGTNLNIAGVAATGAGAATPSSIIITVTNQIFDPIPNVMFARASGANEVYFPRAEYIGANAFRVQFYQTFGGGDTPVDPTVEDLDFYFTATGHTV